MLILSSQRGEEDKAIDTPCVCLNAAFPFYVSLYGRSWVIGMDVLCAHVPLGNVCSALLLVLLRTRSCSRNTSIPIGLGSTASTFCGDAYNFLDLEKCS